MFSFVLGLFVILFISRFGFEGWIWVLIASVPGLCILLTLKTVNIMSIKVYNLLSNTQSVGSECYTKK